MISGKYFLYTISCALLCFSCSKDPLSDLSDLDTQIYITNRDKQIDFKQYKTFSVVDSVQVVNDNYSDVALTGLDRDMLTRIVVNMEKLGYTYVAVGQKPDVGINLARVTNTSVNVVSQPISPYWGYGYGYGYGYPSYYQLYESSESYWSMSMIDLKNPDTTNNTLKVVWNARIRGTALGDEDYVDNMVDEVFGQSAYLKIN